MGKIGNRPGDRLREAVEAYNDLTKRLKEAEAGVNLAFSEAGAAPSVAMQIRREVEAEWQAARDEVVEAAQQWAAHYG